MDPFWKKEPQSRGLAIFLCVFSCLFFASVPLAIKGAKWETLSLNETLLPITGIKSAATAITVMLLIGPTSFERRIKSHNQIFAMLARTCVNICWVCVLSMALPSGTAVLLFFTYPSFTLLFSWRTVTRLDVIAMSVSTIGVAFCVGNEIHVTGWLGISIALLAALANGAYVHFISKVSTSQDRLNSFIWTETLCGLLALPLLWINESPSYSTWCAMILSGVVMGLGMFLLLKTMNKLKGHETSQILLLQPLLTIIIGVLVLGERVSLGIYIGGALIIGGCFLRFSPKKG